MRFFSFKRWGQEKPQKKEKLKMNYRNGLYESDKKIATAIFKNEIFGIDKDKDLLIDIAVDKVYEYRLKTELWELYCDLPLEKRRFLKSIMRNAIRDYLRCNDTTDNDTDILDTIADKRDYEPEHALAYQNLIADIKDIFKGYTDRHKKIIRMYLNHRSMREISRFFGLHIKTVEQYVNRFRQAVSKRIEPQD
jgi:RNA polymerase sigma factor (sigma-70 family)